MQPGTSNSVSFCGVARVRRSIFTTKVTDWSGLWQELAERYRSPQKVANGRPIDCWLQRAESFDVRTKTERSIQADPLMEFLMNSLGPASTFLDIGAGTGRWAIPAARIAQRVTAIEPSPAMLTHLRQNIARAGLGNVALVEARWEDAQVHPHDVVLCSHAMYASPDFLGFVGKMERSALYKCFLVMRVPSADGVIGQLCRRFYGHMHDSPNFVIGYNILCEAGIVANVLIEPSIRPWRSQTLDEALQRAKRHLRLGEASQYDSDIRELLSQRLQFKDGTYWWPDGMRSALVWWNVTPS